MHARLLILALAAILIAGCTINPEDTALGHSKPGQANATAPAGSSANQSGAISGQNASLFTMAEVAKHGSKEDCWMAIDNKILDLTGYVAHPGGDTYVPYCGTDATQAFNDKGGRSRNHTAYAFAMIEDYAIGELGQPMNGSQAGGGSGTPAGPGQGAPPADGDATSNASVNGSSGTPDVLPSNASTAPATILTMEEVARHSTANDCWMVIYGKVLNLTVFTSHPGGSTYVPYCGTEATQAFDTKGGRGNAHSSGAAADLAAYTIGELGSPQNRTVDAANVSISGGGGDDDDDEDEWEDD